MNCNLNSEKLIKVRKFRKSYLFFLSIARTEKFGRPVERIENFDTSSNNSKTIKNPKTESGFNKYEPSTYSNQNQNQPPASWSNQQKFNDTKRPINPGPVKYEQSRTTSQMSHHLESNNDEDELLLSVDLHTIEAPNQIKQQQQQQSMNRQPFSNASNNQQMRVGPSNAVSYTHLTLPTICSV